MKLLTFVLIVCLWITSIPAIGDAALRISPAQIVLQQKKYEAELNNIAWVRRGAFVAAVGLVAITLLNSYLAAQTAANNRDALVKRFVEIPHENLAQAHVRLLNSVEKIRQLPETTASFSLRGFFKNQLFSLATYIPYSIALQFLTAPFRTGVLGRMHNALVADRSLAWFIATKTSLMQNLKDIQQHADALEKDFTDTAMADALNIDTQLLVRNFEKILGYLHYQYDVTTDVLIKARYAQIMKRLEDVTHEAIERIELARAGLSQPDGLRAATALLAYEQTAKAELESFMAIEQSRKE